MRHVHRIHHHGLLHKYQSLVPKVQVQALAALVNLVLLLPQLQALSQKQVNLVKAWITSKVNDLTKTNKANNKAKTSKVNSKVKTNKVSSSKTKGTTYVVQAGDSWYRIAANNGVSLDALLAANGATVETTILPGQTIVIP